MSAVDPDLVGVWIVAGEPRTYEVEADGGYHVADPESPVAYEQGGAVMIWEGEAHDRLAGAGATPEGDWRGRDTGALWSFAADGTYTVTLDGATDTGIWAAGQDGATLWTRERVATLATNGAQVTYTLREGGTATYGYTVGGGIWTLHDPVSWVELARFVDPATL
ncbi:hypothetical protein [Roseicyclus persicicus]|uniref:Uncharacterized protein n=1 Tax=Roseicyclus persicicus TaxID=2650661 RepID=A0A7X6GVK2_9RHOB|nr:hypothetical protein [Roseibacterium persicicum]NKX43171.1 hypothetical protein [Roseibacterium persicicum]